MRSTVHTPVLRAVPVLPALALVALIAAGCGSSASGEHNGRVTAVGAENEYANVIAQVGGRYVATTAIESNPNTDPHTFEASPSVAQEVSAAQLLVENGVGYDTYMQRIASSSPSSTRKVINVQKLLGLPESTPNPHLWYKPTTMPKVAEAIATDLAALQPAHAAYFHANAARFIHSLDPWLTALRDFRARYGGTPVATTEPVSDYMLEAAGIENETPFSMQADIMNGTDPAPQNVTHQEDLFSAHKVKVFVHNAQVTSPLTESFVQDAKHAGVPVVGVYETMPVPGYDYQSWMLAEVKAIERAVREGVSTEKL